MSVKVYVEGGGDHNKALDTACRRGFREFFESAGLLGRLPRIVASGGRGQAFKDFSGALTNAPEDQIPLLVVDAEGPVGQPGPWAHLRLRDGWEQPRGTTDQHIHLMVQAMEAWFHADKGSLQEYYGQGFRIGALRARQDIENIPKTDLFEGLAAATRDCQKGEYSKGQHSFKILARINPVRVREASAHAERLLATLDRLCTAE